MKGKIGRYLNLAAHFFLVKIQWIKEKYHQYRRPASEETPRISLNAPLPNDEEFIVDTKAAMLNKPMLLTSSILYILLVFIIVGLIWSYFGEIDQSTTAEGKVIPASEGKIIQSLDGGVITHIFVKEGDIVHEGEPLVAFDDTRYKADYNTDYEQYLALEASVARLMAEAENVNQIHFPVVVMQKNPDLALRETKLFEAKRQALKVETANLQEQLNHATEEMEKYKPLLKGGYVSEVEYLQSKQRVVAAKQQLLEKQNRYKETVLTELNQSKANLRSLKEKLVSLQDKITRARVLSPVYGMVKKVHVTTIGGVINPGINIMEIVPLSDSLLIQARVKPSDIGFIQPGQAASIKITAYDYTRYGSLDGKVEFVSPDVIEDTKTTSAGKQEMASYYLVNVRTDKSYLVHHNKELHIIPGMSAMVQIKTGKRTIFQYFLKPLLKAKTEALQEG